MIYDLVIVGGGPAGLSAAIYSARFKMKTLLLASEMGGALARTNLVENWPGFRGISGMDLMQRISDHAVGVGAEIKQTEVISLKKYSKNFILKSDDGDFEARTVILATGTRRRKLGVPGEDEFYGRGVSYCAVCDAAFFKGKTVAVVGGCDAATKEALLLAEHAKKVYLIYRREKIRAEPINAERVEKNKKIEIIRNTNVLRVNGREFVESVALDRGYKGKKELKVGGLFIDVGYEPRSELAKEIGAKLENGEIVVGADMSTNIPGLYAAGDVVSGSFKQAITAAAQGVIAAKSAYKYLNK